jgi:predicted nucleotidyltransferase
MIKFEEIKSLNDQIVREFQPDRVILFGSYASGQPSNDSDVDLLVILPFKGKPIRKALEIRNKINPKLPVDLLVITPEQLKDRFSKNDWFVRDILEKGLVLYEANDTRMVSES